MNMMMRRHYRCLPLRRRWVHHLWLVAGLWRVVYLRTLRTLSGLSLFAAA